MVALRWPPVVVFPKPAAESDGHSASGAPHASGRAATRCRKLARLICPVDRRYAAPPGGKTTHQPETIRFRQIGHFTAVLSRMTRQKPG